MDRGRVRDLERSDAGRLIRGLVLDLIGDRFAEYLAGLTGLPTHDGLAVHVDHGQIGLLWHVGTTEPFEIPVEDRQIDFNELNADT